MLKTMKQTTFEDFLSDKCECHTNNDPAGFENWLERLDSQEIMDYAEEYGKEQYEAGHITGELKERNVIAGVDFGGDLVKLANLTLKNHVF